jgi:hypothetical protein
VVTGISDHRFDRRKDRFWRSLQRQNDNFLLFPAIRGQLARATIADEVIGRIPVLDNVESPADLPLKLSGGKVIAEKARLFSLTKLGNALYVGCVTWRS